MADKEVVETSEAQIAVHWQEEALIYPPAEFVAQANMTDMGIYDRFSLDNFPNCFKEYADLLEWYEYWDTILDASDAPAPQRDALPVARRRALRVFEGRRRVRQRESESRPTPPIPRESAYRRVGSI